MRGRLPKPSGIRVLEGNPSRRPLPATEPQYPVGVPERPKKMTSQARRVWDELVTEMAPAGVLRRTDGRALWHLSEDEALLEEAYSGMRKMVKALEAKAKQKGKELPGGPLFGLLGMTSGRLAMAAIRDLGARVILERREFGLTPSSRTRVSGSSEGLIDALEEKLCG